MQQREIFIQALQFDDPGRRAAFLDEACGSNLDLRRDLEELLAAHVRKTPFILDRAAQDAPLSSERVLEQPGDTIGVYRLDAVLGEGGMGVVFIAEQTEPVCRKVALKVIKPGMDSRQVVARFEAERQALALMSHPHIAKVYDGGVTQTGRPYFVMELVEGIAITDFCDQHEIGIAQRLDLMAAVSKAVEHAHRKGVIHRDLKPANILVELQDGRPTPKVIDFGIAKAPDQRLSAASIHTAFTQVVGTPYYMSPEQAIPSGADVDARSDVYSLGVVLYELLTGTKPLDETSLADSGLTDYRELICRRDPPRPSQRVKTLTDETSATIARCRQARPERLPESLRGELDWIVLKALEKDPARRYQSAQELADDLTRYQADLPVLACPPTAAYRMTKVVRRYRTLLATTVVVAAALLVGLSTAIWQAHRARVAEAKAEANLHAAVASTKSLTRALYASDMLAATRLHYQGEYSQVREILDRYRADALGPGVARGYEWHLLNRLQATEVDPLWKTAGAIRALDVQPTSELAALGDSYGRITLFDLTKRRVLDKKETSHGEVQDLCFIAADRLATCGNDGKVSLWKIDRSKVQTAIQLAREIDVSTRGLWALAYCHTTGMLWAGGDDATVYQLDLAGAGRPVAFPGLGEHRITALASTSGNGLLLGNYGGLAGYWEAGREEPTWTLDQSASRAVVEIAVDAERKRALVGQLTGWITGLERDDPPRIAFTQLLPDTIYTLTLSDDGRWAAAGDAGGRIHLLPVADDRQATFLHGVNARGRRLQSWKVHDAKVERVRFVPTNQRTPAVLSAARDGTLCLSRPLTQPASFFEPDVGASDFLLLEDQCLLIVDASLSLRQLEPGLSPIDAESAPAEAPRLAAARLVEHPFFLDDNRVLYELPAIDGKIAPRNAWRVCWKANSGELAPNFAVSPDGLRWAADIRSESTRRHRYEIYETGATEPLATFPGHSAVAMTFSPDGRSLALVQENNVILHDAATGQRLAVLSGHRDRINDLAFAPDSRSLASVSADRSVICWDVGRHVARWSSMAHENGATAVAFHPTMPTLATTGEDAMVRFWRIGDAWGTTTSRLVGELPLQRGRPLRMEFSPNGQSLVISHRSRGISVLEASGGK